MMNMSANGRDLFNMNVGKGFIHSGNSTGFNIQCEYINNTGQIQGDFLAVLGDKFTNPEQSLLDFETFTYLPNATQCDNKGSFHTHILMVHEDIAKSFSESSYDHLITIPHHEDHWSDEECQEYLIKTLNENLDLFQ